jgi:ABC-type spermidine/putrescine transport systems, ATPase components
VYVTHDQAEALAISDRVAVMRDGRFEQVAAPETVYQNPASPAVAEFIGDNNLFSGRVTQDERRLTVGSDVIPLPESVGASGGDSLTIAVRPESISIGPNQPADTASLPGTVQTVEFLGDAYRVHCEWAGQTVLAKTPADAPPEDRVDLWFHLDDIQVIPTE